MDKKGNTKLIWYILFAFITIIMCYLFSVVYFFFISPYNVSLKTNIWPFLSDEQIGNFYSDAIVDINFNVEDDEYFGEVEVSTVGVNVRQDGYIIARYDYFYEISEQTEIKVFAKSGQIYQAKVLYCDKNNNLVVLKCQSDDEIKIPYVKIAELADDSSLDLELIGINEQDKKVATGTLTDCDLADSITSVSEGVYKVDHVAENCFSAELSSNFKNGLVFDKKGNFMGFSLNQSSSQFSVMPVAGVKDYLSEIILCYENEETYTNELVDSFVGFDSYEVHFFMDESEKNTDKTTFYFNGQNNSYTDDIKYFGGPNQTGYYLFADLIYKQQTVLSAENVITSIYLNKTSYEIDSRSDLTSILYKACEGDVMTIYYHKIDSLGIEVKSVTLEV